jgi:hypothetical protein
MNRHRFVGEVGEQCAAQFGGAAWPCRLSYGASQHFNDEDHPYTLAPSALNVGEGCQWILQNNVPGFGVRCGRKEPEHRADWFEPRVRVPDEDAEAAEAGGGRGRPESLADVGDTPTDRLMTALAEEAGQYAWGKEHKMRILGLEVAPWEQAIAALEGEDGEVRHGPWPVRRFRLPDGAGVGLSGSSYENVCNSLDVLEEDYTTQIWRPAGAEYRLALVTWGWANGLGFEAICDELALRFDDAAGGSTLNPDEQD